TLPIALTLGRIVAIPLIIALYYLPYPWADPAAGVLFALAGITDSLDGYLARKWGQTSRLGEFLDPVADKLIVATALVLIVTRSEQPVYDVGFPLPSQPIVALAAIVIIGREIAVSALREWMAELGARGKVAVSALGKLKTILQIVGLSMLLFRWNMFGIPIYELGLALTVIAAVLTLWSMAQYLRAAWPELAASH
ncbi:MAG TPA: CDP-diacylglycerol--glycerol-3-phosphate 3-phosphatidyltransferase, partial [Steroidobacteraceae bacterium]|nr:CDP-diacylglycerol--glycerol-3-phosphate 3-phosphatidyltransferase [Steroidobacteraceae bacterium]